MTEHEQNLRDLAAMFAMTGLIIRNEQKPLEQAFSIANDFMETREFMNNLNKQMDDLQRQANMIRSAPIPADEKQEMLREITKAQNLLVNDIRQIRNILKP